MEENAHILTPPALGEKKYSPKTAIIDQHGRTFTYMRIAINEACNLRCMYCMPEDGIAFNSKRNLMTTDEILTIITEAGELGVNKVRFTGGEPLLHPRIGHLIKTTSKTPGIDSVHITTNAILLKDKVQELIQGGLDSVNISLDTLDKEKYFLMTRRDSFRQAMEGLDSALTAGFSSVKINAVVLRGFNDDELIDFAKLTKYNAITVRFIELMPFDAHQIWKTGKFMSADHIKQVVLNEFPKMTQAEGTRTEHDIYQIPGFLGKVAIIPAFSRNLCGDCNRIRITADGKIRNCLFANEESNVLEKIRNGYCHGDVKNMLIETMQKKPIDGWSAGENGGNSRNSMAQIGG